MTKTTESAHQDSGTHKGTLDIPTPKPGGLRAKMSVRSGINAGWKYAGFDGEAKDENHTPWIDVLS